MSCITFKNAATGAERKVEVAIGQSVLHGVGEVIVSVDRKCGPQKSVPQQGANRASFELLQELDKELGGGAGDWIKTLVNPFAKMIGKKSCTTCEARRLATNAYGKLKVKYGQAQALSMIRELWQMSMTQSGDKVLEKLKGYLDGNG
jgi:hypothetical protein